MEPAVVFKALGDSTRQRIMQLVARQELTVSELVEVLGQPQSTVSRHLRVLKDAELIGSSRCGPMVAYRRVEPPANHSETAQLSRQLLEWAAAEPLPRTLTRRLQAVIGHRHERAAAFFDRIGGDWDRLRRDYFGTCFPFESLTALLPAEWVVADIGTGTGFLLGHLAKRFARVIAVDPAAAMLEVARSRPELAGRDNIEFRSGDLAHVPIEDRTVDLAVAALVLHHAVDPSQALSELHRIARPGGRLLLIEQAAEQCREFYEQMHDRWWGFDPTELAGRVAAAGFERISHSWLDSAEQTNREGSQPPGLYVLTATRQEAPGDTAVVSV